MESGNGEVTVINEEEWLGGMELGNFSCLPMAIKAVIELDVLQIIATAGYSRQISPRQIVTQIPGVSNPAAAVALDRILRVLASHSILTSSLTTDMKGKQERLYGLTALCKYLVMSNEGFSLASTVLMYQDNFLLECWNCLKDAVLEGCQPFVKAHGVNVFEYVAIDPKSTQVFNRAMAEHSTMLMKKILDDYEGFKDLEELVDVGGGIGSTLNLIISKYPHIKGVNFDLPHVVKVAPEYLGVTQVAGNMFESVPSGTSGTAIFMKWILHNWSDDHCLKILKNCHKALKDGGKVIVMDTILPVAAETSSYARLGFHMDLLMLANSPNGKERTEQEFRYLAKGAGFAGGVKPICCLNGMWVMEFYRSSP